MKKLIYLSLIAMMYCGTAKAEGETISETTPAKSQEEIMDEFNDRAGIDVKLYPNPAVNSVTIESKLRSGSEEIRILDVTGRIKAEMHMEPGSNGVTIDVSDYMNGLYVLALYDDAGNLLHISRFYKD